MTAGQIKGALLKYIVRQLLINCGFTSVKPDGHYVFAQEGNGLFFVNGKGAAHDADTLMDPPIQMPFSYPSRLLFECKSYEKSIGLNVIRNALGLRYDINEFEIVTHETIELRKNNHRENYAIDNRKRYNYQVGVASVENFSKPAFEFAGNNKIPLLSMRWFLTDRICNLFHAINSEYVGDINETVKENLYSFLKDKRKTNWNQIGEFLDNDDVIGDIIRYAHIAIRSCMIGLLETGDIIFLFATQQNSFQFLNNVGYNTLMGRLHFYENEENVWYLELIDNEIDTRVQFKFFVPERIMKQWSSLQLDRNQALNIKEQYFSRIFLFQSNQHQSRNRLPFLLINIDENWLNNARARLNNNE
jgi:hypothetical protein